MARKCLEPYILSGDDDYIDMLLGKKEMHRKWWLYNRFRYLDSKYETGNSMDTRLMIRAKGKSNLVLTSYVDMYGRVYYNSEMVEHRMTRGQEYEFVWAASGAEDAVVGVNDADMITSLGDLSPLQVETINIANATHLTALKIGDGASTYVNNALTSVGFGNNVLLRSLDLRNCVALTQSLDASGCSNIEEVLCDGSSITGIALPNGGIIKTLHLPNTITNLTVLNQTNITDFSMPNYDNLTTLRIENCPAIATDYIILHAPNLNRVRLLDVDWNIMDETFLERLDSCRGKDENNLDVDRPVITGRAVINVPVSESMIEYWKNAFPDLELTFAKIGYSVTFVDWDGTILKTQDVISGGRANPPASLSRPSTTEYEYVLTGWDNEYTNVTENVVCTAVYASYLRRYTVRFYDGDTLLQEKLVPYGMKAEYTGKSFNKEHDSPDLNYWIFDSWYPNIDCVIGDINAYAQWEEKTFPVFQKAVYPDDTHRSVIVPSGEGPGLFFAVTSWSDTISSYYVSNDLVNWEYVKVDSNNYFSRTNRSRIQCANGVYFGCYNRTGDVGTSYYFYHTINGITWTKSNFECLGYIQDVIWDGDNYIILAGWSVNIVSQDLSTVISSINITNNYEELYFDDYSHRLIFATSTSRVGYSNPKENGYLNDIYNISVSNSFNLGSKEEHIVVENRIFSTPTGAGTLWDTAFSGTKVKGYEIDYEHNQLVAISVRDLPNLGYVNTERFLRPSVFKIGNNLLQVCRSSIYSSTPLEETVFIFTKDFNSYIIKKYDSSLGIQITSNYIVATGVLTDGFYFAINTISEV